jgi:O-antigen/teichoic acid export membrane protein
LVTSSTPGRPSNTHTITRNSFWYGLELLSSSLATVFVSVIVARIIGPERLGYYTYMMTLTNFTVALGVFGLPMTARKYMSEFLNSDRRGLAHSVYRNTLRLQLWIAGALTAAALALVFVIGDPHQRVISILLVVNMAPRMVGFIPSQANNAAEALERNTIPAVVSGALNLVLTVVSLLVGWDLPGIAAALLVATTFDMVWKLYSVRRWLGDSPPIEIPSTLRRQMFLYSGQGLVLMLLNVVVWDRSDLIFLKALNPDIKQVTFFSVAFTLTERILNLPNAFGGSLAVTLMAQYGRGSEKLKELTVEGARYSFLIALPLLVGIACVAGPAVLLVYGPKYAPLIPVLMVVALLAIPKTLTLAPTTLLQATENQGFLVIWGCICGAINIVLDILLTPRYGAVGAAWANGTAQGLSTLGVWLRVYTLFHPALRGKVFARIGVSGAGMALTAIALTRAIPGVAGLVAAILMAALVWCVLLRITGALDEADARRLRNMSGALPGRVRPAWSRMVGLIAAH